MTSLHFFSTLVASALLLPVANAQRTHNATQKGELKLGAAVSTPAVKGEVTIKVVGDERIITSNGIPNHKTGQFPNRGNPNRISAQSNEVRLPLNPKVADRITPIRHLVGFAINGIPFEPGAGEFYSGDRGWQYEPLSGAISMGIDVSHAHVQPTGKYHYHGLPTKLLESVKIERGKHSPIIGWAMDGFPIYAVQGYRNAKDPSHTKKLRPSYQLKKGERPGGNAPGGKYDGTFVRDYEYVAGSGDLDECNGRFTVTPEFPEGTYAYFLTEQWPVIPRNLRGTVVNSRGGPGGGQQAGGPGGPGGRQGGPGGGAGGPRGGGPGGGPPGPERLVEHAMTFDADGDGKLSKAELTKFAEQLGSRSQRGPGAGGPGGRGPGAGGPGAGGPGGQGRRGPDTGGGPGNRQEGIPNDRPTRPPLEE